MPIPSSLNTTLRDENAERKQGVSISFSELPYDKWVELPALGWRPPARYKHAAAVVGEKLYIVAGSRHGRYLADIQVFDLATSAWTTIKLNKHSTNGPEEVLPACFGHKLIYWKNKLLIIGGHLKEYSGPMKVWSMDLEAECCNVVKTHGEVPVARGGHSVILAGSKLVVFGGEDKRKNLLNDLHLLDLETMTWDAVHAVKNGPTPRFDHAAAVHSDRYLLIFGGSTHSTCYNDLHALDLPTMEWSQPMTQGEVVTPRAGHAGVAVDGTWFIVGGGDNKTGACETIKLNMTNFVWSTATSVPKHDPLASEGISVCSTTVEGFKLLVAFGGYNGKYHNEVFVLKCRVNPLKQRRIVQSPAAAAAAASVTAAYALASTAETVNNEVNVKETTTSDAQKIESIAAEKKTLESKLAELRADNLRLKGSLTETTSLHGELCKELRSVQDLLHAERSRCTTLEAQIEGMQRRLGILPSVELELESLRQERSTWQSVVPKKQASPGLWKWAAGSSS
ncbi:galactose oxidase/kelch repeat superfamily protein [Wolffia australiana]